MQNTEENMCTNEVLGIYIHVPWCHRRCSYCDFYFEIGRPAVDFADLIKREYLHRRRLWPSNPAQTVYFGGGTPSLLAAGEIASIIQFLRAQGELQNNAEMTLEANPEDLTQNKIEAFRAAGINRISLGVQSFDNHVLKFLGRKHDAHQARQILELCAGFMDSVSMDLIIGVPGETKQIIGNQLEWASEKNIGHISVYILTVEEDTPLQKMIAVGRRKNIDDDAQAQIYEDIQLAMTQLGYLQYEVASFAKSGHESRHNRIYWSKGSYLGLGPGAHSMRVLEEGSVERSHNIAGFPKWRLAPEKANVDIEVLTPKKAYLEALAFGVRDIAAGIDPARLAKRHRQEPSEDLYLVLDAFVARGLLDFREGVFFLTPLGARYADLVSREILGL